MSGKTGLSRARNQTAWKELLHPGTDDEAEYHSRYRLAKTATRNPFYKQHFICRVKKSYNQVTPSKGRETGCLILNKPVGFNMTFLIHCFCSRHDINLSLGVKRLLSRLLWAGPAPQTRQIVEQTNVLSSGTLALGVAWPSIIHESLGYII